MEPRTYFLPWPISANARMGVINGRQILSRAARKWYEHAAEELMLQRPKAVRGPVELFIHLCAPTKRKYDIDNRAKVAIDAMVRNGIIEDDDNTILRKLTIKSIDIPESPEAGPGAYVTVSPLVGEG